MARAFTEEGRTPRSAAVRPARRRLTLATALGRLVLWIARNAVTAVALTACAALLLGFLGPLKHDLDAFATLRPHFAAAALLAGLAAAALGARPVAAIALLFAGAGVAGLGPALSWPRALPADCPSDPLRIVVANVEASTETRAAWPASIDAVLAADGDLIFATEMTPDYLSFDPRLTARYPYLATHARGATGLGRLDQAFGAVILSRAPLRATGLTADNRAPAHAFASVDFAGRAVSLAAMHLGRPIVQLQERQLNAIAPVLSALPGPRIVAGDFNAAPWGHAVRTLADASGAEPAPGLRRTWRGVYPNPFHRSGLLRGVDTSAPIGAQIDWLLADPVFRVERVATFDLAGSVHWGVVADLRLPRDASDPRCAA